MVTSRSNWANSEMGWSWGQKCPLGNPRFEQLLDFAGKPGKPNHEACEVSHHFSFSSGIGMVNYSLVRLLYHSLCRFGSFWHSMVSLEKEIPHSYEWLTVKHRGYNGRVYHVYRLLKSLDSPINMVKTLDLSIISSFHNFQLTTTGSP